MIDKYIYAVTRELSKSSREHTSTELFELIQEKMNALDSSLSEEEKTEHVLRELGDPKLLANKYRGKDRYLIGPMYFDNYLSVLKVVSLSILVGISVAFGISTIFSIKSLAEIIGGYLAALLSALAQGAMWVTGIFGLLEYFEVSLESAKKTKPWEPSDLPDLPEEKARISRGESIFSLIVTTLFFPLFFFSPNILGFYYKIEGQSGFLPFFNIENFTLFRIIIFIVFTFNILIELIKIIKGRWTLKLALIISLLNSVSSVLFILSVSKLNIWNVEMVNTLEKYLPISFDRMILFIIAIIIIVTIAESISSFYKGYKYGN